MLTMRELLRMFAAMTLREALISTVQGFVAVSRMGQRRLSTILFGSGARFDQICAGSDISTGTYERVMLWLSDNWPEGAVWPEGVDRPGQCSSAASDPVPPTIPEAAE